MLPSIRLPLPASHLPLSKPFQGIYLEWSVVSLSSHHTGALSELLAFLVLSVGSQIGFALSRVLVLALVCLVCEASAQYVAPVASDLSHPLVPTEGYSLRSAAPWLSASTQVKYL